MQKPYLVLLALFFVLSTARWLVRRRDPEKTTTPVEAGIGAAIAL